MKLANEMLDKIESTTYVLNKNKSEQVIEGIKRDLKQREKDNERLPVKPNYFFNM